jgi:hypothetical protein
MHTLTKGKGDDFREFTLYVKSTPYVLHEEFGRILDCKNKVADRL